MLRYPISPHSRSDFIFVKLIMMSENNFDRGEVWLIADVTWSPLIDSLIPWKRVFLYDKGKSMWINDIVICSGCLVFLSKSTYSSYSVCFSLLCGLSAENWQLCSSSILGWAYWIFPKGLTHDFESKFQNLSFDYFSCK